MNDLTVTVITPTLPERADMLARCMAAVDAQTVAPAAHLIGVDHAHTGHGARIRNRLIAAADSTWIACCDDDDWFLPNHLELLLTHSFGADVVMAEFTLETGGPPIYPHLCNPAVFEKVNPHHPSSLLLRRHAVLDVGGFPDPAPPMWDDWALLLALYKAGARFACVHQATSVKGVHAGCISAVPA